MVSDHETTFDKSARLTNPMPALRRISKGKTGLPAADQQIPYRDAKLVSALRSAQATTDTSTSPSDDV